MPPTFDQPHVRSTRRHWLGRTANGLGAAALAWLQATGGDSRARASTEGSAGNGGLRFPARARRVIYLFMHGGPSQVDLLDPKPGLANLHGAELPASIRATQRLTGMTSGQKRFPVVASRFKFVRHGQSGTALSELLPRLGERADDLCVVRSLHTEAINHDPAVTYLQTGHPQPGRPSLGAWLSYGLGGENADLPAFVVLISRGSAARPADPLFARLWGAEFLPSNHQGVQFRAGKEPVLYLANPPGLRAEARRRQLDALAALNRRHREVVDDPEIVARIAQYETAFRMQTAAPETIDFSREPEHVLDRYGPDVRRPGSFAANCLLARRMAERGVRFIQLYHRGWDQHYDLPTDLRAQCGDVDRPCAALLADLKQRGLLEDTLVVWAGEFGRTVYCQGELKPDNHGRDHHGGCFSGWLAGGGVRGGQVYGETDEFSFNVLRDGVHVHDWNATILHCLGIDHTQLTYPFQGRDYRLTDVSGEVVQKVLA